MKSFILISFCIGFISCEKPSEIKETKKHLTKNTPEPILERDWKDSLVIEYLKNPKNKLIKGTINSDDSLPIAWMTENREMDGKLYTVVQIGKNTKDRFATAGLIYLDSINKKIYDYDPFNDSLILWTNK